MRFQSSYYPTKKDELDSKDWFIIDADGMVLGRLASQVAKVLRGKHKATYSPSVDMGDFVVIVNSDKVIVTGNKNEDKMYHKHSGYAGGLKSQSFKDYMKKDSRKVIRAAVEGMLPHNRLGRAMLPKLKIYRDSAHPHEAQSPKPLSLKG